MSYALAEQVYFMFGFLLGNTSIFAQLPSLSCSSISHDGSLIAGGFSDSSLKVIFFSICPLPSTPPIENPLSKEF